MYLTVDEMVEMLFRHTAAGHNIDNLELYLAAACGTKAHRDNKLTKDLQ